jgi:hypothetical protein
MRERATMFWVGAQLTVPLVERSKTVTALHRVSFCTKTKKKINPICLLFSFHKKWQSHFTITFM